MNADTDPLFQHMCFLVAVVAVIAIYAFGYWAGTTSAQTRMEHNRAVETAILERVATLQPVRGWKLVRDGEE